MKKKTVLQKLAAAGLAMAMVAGTLTGCGGGGNDAAGNDNADAATTEDAATSEDTSADDAAADDGASADAEGDTILRIIRQDSRRQLPFRFPFTREDGKAGILQTTTGRNGFRRTLATSIT